MGLVLGGSLLLFVGVISFYTVFYLQQHIETVKEVTNPIMIKPYLMSFVANILSMVLIIFYLSGLNSENSSVFGTPMVPGGMLIYMMLFIGLYGFYCLSICMKVASTVEPENTTYQYAQIAYNWLVSIFSVLLLIALLTTTKNKSMFKRIMVLVAGCVIVLHMNLMHRVYWMGQRNVSSLKSLLDTSVNASIDSINKINPKDSVEDSISSVNNLLDTATK